MHYTRESIASDLENIYITALQNKNLPCALRAKWMQAQVLGLTHYKPIVPPKLNDMTDEEICQFIAVNNIK